jgi:hypothetical protein
MSTTEENGRLREALEGAIKLLEDAEHSDHHEWLELEAAWLAIARAALAAPTEVAAPRDDSDTSGRDYRKERDAAYRERNQVVAALAGLIVANGGRAWLAQHNDDPTWDPEWMTIVFIEGRTGQLSWHLHDSDVALFAWLPRGENTWDGHTTPEKYERVASLAAIPSGVAEVSPQLRCGTCGGRFERIPSTPPNASTAGSGEPRE